MEFTEGNLIPRIWIFSGHLESDHASLEHLSSETCVKHSDGVTAFSSWSSCFQKYFDLSQTQLPSLQLSKKKVPSSGEKDI